MVGVDGVVVVVSDVGRGADLDSTEVGGGGLSREDATGLLVVQEQSFSQETVDLEAERIGGTYRAIIQFASGLTTAARSLIFEASSLVSRPGILFHDFAHAGASGEGDHDRDDITKVSEERSVLEPQQSCIRRQTGLAFYP